MIDSIVVKVSNEAQNIPAVIKVDNNIYHINR